MSNHALGAAGRRPGKALRFAAAAACLAAVFLVLNSCEPGTNPTNDVGPDAFSYAGDRLGDIGRINGWGGLASFDYDNDGDIDLLITSRDGAANRLLQNDGNANFVDVAEEAGVAMTDDNCMGCAVGDLNNDGRLDLLLGRQRFGLPEDAPSWTVVFLNNGPNDSGVVTFSELVPAQTGLTSEVPSCALGIGDFDNDGMLDVLIGRYDVANNGLLVVPIYPSQPNELWRCTGLDGNIPRFEQITTAGIEGTEQNGFSEDTADESFIPGTFVLYLTDVDEDGYLDVFDLQDIPGVITYFHNNGDMTFTSQFAHVLGIHGGWMGMAGGDYDADGDIDYFATNVGSDFTTFFPPDSVASAHLQTDATYFHKLLRNDGGALVDVTASTAVTPSTLLPPENELGGCGLQGLEFGFGATWIDAKNDGRLDLYWAGDLITYIQPGLTINWHGVGRFLENKGDGTFADRTAERGLFNFPSNAPAEFGWQEAGRGVAACDLNGDGFQDLVVTNSSIFGTPDATVRLFLNPANTSNHWLTVRLFGVASNRFGIGARVLATVGGHTYVSEVLTTSGAFTGLQPQAHFGLGEALSVDTLEVRWPSGVVTTLSDVATDQVLTVQEM